MIAISEGEKALSLALLERVLAGTESHEALLAEVVDFYGSGLTVTIRETGDGQSRFAVNIDGPTLQFKSAVIDLCNGPRIKEAAVHELLHLALGARGFPLIYALSIDDRHAPRFPMIDEAIRKAVNVVQHTVFLEEFLQLGLAADRFLSEEPRQTGYGSEAKKYLGGQLDPERAWEAWTWWGLEFLRHHCARRHSGPKTKLSAESIQKWGDRLLHGFKRRTHEMTRLLDGGEQKTPERYRETMTALFGLMSLPADVSYCRLRPRDGLPPRAECA
ncbi:hypothetical protein J1C56_09090 [Aminobacter anthyllidis]|uniref:Uncharacterized protein n=1 Tax=Aminobacter anthyllidis TaxID=1035067 RepID=A0A9X1D596_9HYPH|nr:hypothetical protein [Aminobacter anthyllidis]MBT1155746.1 hypothetical protein [Aminobacter anthyllidis]